MYLLFSLQILPDHPHHIPLPAPGLLHYFFIAHWVQLFLPTHMGVRLPAGAGATLRDTLPKKMDSPFSQCYLLPKTPQVGADIKHLKSFQETELSRRSLLAHLIWSTFWQMSFWHIFTTVMSSIKSFWPEAAELGSVPWHFKKSNKSIFFTKLPNSRDFFFKTGTDGLNTEMGRTETLIRETRTIGLDNHLILHGQKQLELNGEGSIDVHHLSFQPWQS